MTKRNQPMPRDVVAVVRAIEKSPTDILLSIREVGEVVGFKRQTILDLTLAGRFPRPVEISPRKHLWRASELGAWIAGLPPADPHRWARETAPRSDQKAA